MSSGGAARSQGTLVSTDDDGALMRGIRDADASALERLYDRYSPRVFAFCVRCLGDRSEAEDLVLEIFWELWSRPDRYDPARSSPWTYLMKVTRSRTVDRLRSLRSRSARQTAPAGRQESIDDRQSLRTPEPLDQIASREDEDRLRHAIASLTPDQRQSLEMAYFDAMSYSEVAEALGQPLGTIKSRIRQALAHLRQLLA